ncbi:MAG: DedA family protein [Gammaproteobacteria bacterium]
MFTEGLQHFLSFLQAHLWLAYSTIFLVALTESLALVGLIVPGAIMMFAIGTLITTGHLDFTITMVSASLGAIIGDSLSYWLGAHYRQQLQNLWPLSRYPGAFARGIEFFHHHGGKSVLLGRFVGPLRPMIPAIAGMLGMSRGKFLLINILSALAWAPLYLLPGMAFGLSLELAGEVAGRLMLWVLMLFISIFAVVWLARHVYTFALQHTEQWMEALLRWTQRHPTSGQIPSALLEPRHAERRALAWLALLFLTAIIGLTLLTEASAEFGLVQELEQLILNLPPFVQTPVADALFSAVHALSQPLALSLLALGISLWLLAQRQWLLTGHLLLVWLVPVTAMLILSGIEAGNLSQVSDMPGRLFLGSSLLFFLGLVFGKEIRPQRRAAFYAVIAVGLFMLCLSQLYWQVSGFVRASIELLSGIAWAALLGIAYRRHLVQQRTRHKLVPLLALALLGGWAVQAPAPLSPERNGDVTRVWSQQAWRDELWQTLPRRRTDLRQSHQHPFNLQWQGDPASIAAQLAAAGWQAGHTFSWRRALTSLRRTPPTTELLILPHVHHGRYENLRWTKYEQDTLYVIRLWRSRVDIDAPGTATGLWFGNISIMHQRTQLGWRYLQTGTQFTQALDTIRTTSLPFVDKGDVLLLMPEDS